MNDAEISVRYDLEAVEKHPPAEINIGKFNRDRAR